MGREDVGAIEARLLGIPYDRESVAAALDGVVVADYFGDVPADELLELVAP
jgi:hypothetical protein